MSGDGRGAEEEAGFAAEVEAGLSAMEVSASSAPAAQPPPASQQMIIVRTANDAPAASSILVRSGAQMVRMGGASASAAQPPRSSPMKVQLIGGQGLRRSGEAAGSSKAMLLGNQPVLIKPSGSQPSLVAAAGKSGQKVQYYRVMPAADLKAPTPTPAFRPAPAFQPTPPQAPAQPATAATPQPAQPPPEPSPAPSSGSSRRKKSVLPNGNRKPCNCTKSMCLKLYCDCFANGEFCRDCNCKDCHNNLDHESERTKAIKSSLERNPNAFQPKIGKGGRSEIGRMHQKGCHCKKSSCLKNYCECYEAKVPCSVRCKCCGCRNTEADRDAKSKGAGKAACGLLGLASAASSADLRSDSPYTDDSDPASKPNPKTQPWFYMTDEVVECTTLCLMAQAEELEKAAAFSDADMERRVLKEFGRCLKEIIHNASLSAAPAPDPSGL